MRLWSLSPTLLDSKGLVALWREALLAKKVLEDKTRGYKNHPQLERFKASAHPIIEINAYLQQIHYEAERRGYNFDASKIGPIPQEYTSFPNITVSYGQLLYEWRHLKDKVQKRDPLWFEQIQNAPLLPFPDFSINDELYIEPWEKIVD